MARGKTPFPHWAGSFGLDQVTTGRVFYVNSAATNASNGNLGDSPDRPLATIEGFYSHPDVTANNGDTCYVMPNHSETITTAGGITADVAGTRVVGIGWGSQRPRVLLDEATTVTVVVSAADVHMENLVFAGGHNTIATCFDIDAAGFSAKYLKAEDNAADEHFVIFFTVGSTSDNTCDGLSIVGCEWYTLDTGVTHFIDLTGDCDNVTITDNFYCADGATGAQLLSQASGDDIQGLQFLRNRLITGATASPLLINNDQTDNTGIAAYNLAGHHDTAAVELIDCDGIRLFENYSASTDDVSGVLEPAADSIT